MLVKEHNKNSYIVVTINEYLNKKNFYEELLRIKFNKKIVTNNIIEETKYKLKHKL